MFAAVGGGLWLTTGWASANTRGKHARRHAWSVSCAWTLLLGGGVHAASCDWTAHPHVQFLVRGAGLNAAPVKWNVGHHTVVTRSWSGAHAADRDPCLSDAATTALGAEAGGTDSLDHPCWDQQLAFTRLAPRRQIENIACRGGAAGAPTATNLTARTPPHAIVQIGTRTTRLGGLASDWDLVNIAGPRRCPGSPAAAGRYLSVEEYEIECGGGGTALATVSAVAQSGDAGSAALRLRKRIRLRRGCGPSTWVHVAVNINSAHNA